MGAGLLLCVPTKVTPRGTGFFLGFFFCSFSGFFFCSGFTFSLGETYNTDQGVFSAQVSRRFIISGLARGVYNKIIQNLSKYKSVAQNMSTNRPFIRWSP